MCGFCGIATPLSSNRRIDRGQIIRMRETIRHRGPDEEGIFLDEGIGLGHRRLSIIDVSAGHQPMASDDGTLQIVYNGEIYNHLALREDVEAAGATYRTRCDTETVLRMYERDGVAGVSELRGMFAFAIWNRATRELVLARDRLGIKPLYYAVLDDGTLIFGSEIKALLASGHLSPHLNLSAFPEYLANHSTFGDETMFAGVRRLLPGHTLRWRDGAVELRRYWGLSFAGPQSTATEATLIEEYRDRLTEAVRLRLMSDVPLGMFLSGGIDSATITALMATMVDEPVKTFSVAFAEREANELSYARLVAERYRTDHHEVIVDPEQFLAATPRLIWHEDEPIAHPSSVALYFVAELAERHVKVVLTGEGSDETLAGYGRYPITLANLALGQRYQRVVPSGIQDVIRRMIGRLPPASWLKRKLRRTSLWLPADLDTLYFDNFAVFGRGYQDDLLTPDTRAQLAGIDPYHTAHQLYAGTETESLLHRLLAVDIQTYLHELLMKQDQMSMAASIESRVPFLDHPLVEFTTRLPERMKLRRGKTKYILRQAVKDLLPPEILTRRKMGFPVPVGAWFRGPYHHLIDEFVLGERATARGLFRPDVLRRLVHEHDARHVNHDERLWALMNVEIWHRVFLDGESPDDIMAPQVLASAAAS
jgi:asparagine synthase (glutamine-hydrolysing)